MSKRKREPSDSSRTRKRSRPSVIDDRHKPREDPLKRLDRDVRTIGDRLEALERARTSDDKQWRKAKKERNLAVEDFRDAFGVTHEAAGLRLTNLLTTYLDLELHFLRVGGDGNMQKAYENDGLRLPVDVTGSIEGQFVCRRWAARTRRGRRGRGSRWRRRRSACSARSRARASRSGSRVGTHFFPHSARTGLPESADCRIFSFLT